MTKDMYSDIRGAADTAVVKTPDVTRGHRATAQYVLDMLASGERVPADNHVDSLKPGIVPDMKNMGARDAVQALQNLGMKVRVTGKGRVVRQSVAPGTKVVKGQTVSLSLE